MLSNFFCVKREDVDRLLTDPLCLLLYITFLRRARWNGSSFAPGGRELNVGEFYYGSEELSKLLGFSRNAILKGCTRLERSGCTVVRTKGARGTVASICNLELITNNKISGVARGCTPVAREGALNGTLNNNVLIKQGNKEYILSDLTISELYKNYPRKEGKERGVQALRQQLKSEADVETFRKAVKNYAARCEEEKTEKKFIKLFSTFCNLDWKDYVEQEHDSKKEFVRWK